MPLKRYKNDDGQKLSIGQILYTKRYNLTLDRSLCKGCDVCKVVCPREAISLKPLHKAVDGKARAPLVDIDAEKCDYHAICATMCPFGAIKVSLNEQSHLPVVEKDAYPELVRRIEVKSDSCDPECKVCEDKCPLKVVSVSFEPITSEEAARRGIRVKTDGEPMQTIVNIDKSHCATCKICEASCPAQVIEVEKFFNGSIQINQDMCPEGCHDCLDVCPVEALYLEDGKVYPNNEFCVYCRACVNVCPKPEALKVIRTSVRHTDVKSGAWNKSLEKLASVDGMRREFTAKRMTKAKDAIVKRERLEEKS